MTKEELNILKIRDKVKIHPVFEVTEIIELSGENTKRFNVSHLIKIRYSKLDIDMVLPYNMLTLIKEK